MEQDKESSALRLLSPIDASYQPSRAVTKLPATSSLEDILAVLERDGGVVLVDFVELDTLDKIDEELEPYSKPSVNKDSYDNFIGKKTVVIPGLVGKSDTIASILETNKTIEKLLKVILEERYPAVFEHHTEELVVEPLLSISLAFNVSQGSPRQALHRDDMIFSSKHHPNMKINEVDGFSCFIAGTKITRENGGTMIILGSHKWEHERRGRPDEVSFLGKSVFYKLVCRVVLSSTVLRNGARVRLHFSQQLGPWSWIQHYPWRGPKDHESCVLSRHFASRRESVLMQPSKQGVEDEPKAADLAWIQEASRQLAGNGGKRGSGRESSSYLREDIYIAVYKQSYSSGVLMSLLARGLLQDSLLDHHC